MSASPCCRHHVGQKEGGRQIRPLNACLCAVSYLVYRLPFGNHLSMWFMELKGMVLAYKVIHQMKEVVPSYDYRSTLEGLGNIRQSEFPFIPLQ